MWDHGANGPGIIYRWIQAPSDEYYLLPAKLYRSISMVSEIEQRQNGIRFLINNTSSLNHRSDLKNVTFAQ